MPHFHCSNALAAFVSTLLLALQRFRSSADVFQVFVGLDVLMSERSWVNSLGP